MSAAKKKTAEAKSKPTYKLPREGAWASAWKLSAALGGLGAVGCFIGWSSDPHRFAFSWLFALMSFLAIGLGALFFVLWQHLAGAGWSISIRRVPELLMSGLPVLALLVVPVLFQMDELYPWMESWREHAHGEAHEEHTSSEGLVTASVAHAQDHAPAEAHGEGHDAHHTPQHAAHAEVIASKLAYLNQPFFLIRAVIYCAIWIVLVWFFFTSSTKQDTTRDLNLTRRMQSLSPIATFGFALTLTFAAFDWMMSLEPTWFSTIFGVQYFAVSAVSSLAMIVLIVFGLKSAGVFGEAVTTEHFHDLGKLLFGFLVFWAYISFSQFMLIWYASIPEETTYYHLRWSGGWRTFSLFLVIAHFVFPFLLLMSRNVKRRVPVLAFGAAWLLVMHALQVFWLVMPYVNPGELSVHWLDLAALFAVGGAYLTFVFFMMGRYPLVPVGDPRLNRAIHLEVH